MKSKGKETQREGNIKGRKRKGMKTHRKRKEK